MQSETTDNSNSNDTEINIGDAAKHCKVSEQTLKRFIQAGYLKALRNTSEGLVLIEEEVCKLLGVRLRAKEKKIIHKTAETTENSEGSQSETKTEPTLDESQEAATNTKEEAKADSSQEEVAKELPASASEQKVTSNKSLVNAIDPNELVRLQHLCDLQEKLLKKQEEDIEDLKIQRQWYQTRIEKLEQKSERDQLILLSHSQSIVKILDRQNKTSPLQKALSWIGFDTMPRTPNRADFETSGQVSE